MKRLLPALLILLLAFAACKKEVPPVSTPITKKDTVTGQLPTAPITPPTAPVTPAKITVTNLSPSSGKAGTVVTITGTNFGISSPVPLIVSFNGTPATIQSITPTEITVVVPVCRSGAVIVIGGGQNITGPVFTYIDPVLTEPYVNGSVTLRTQSEVDAFAELNKGKQLRLTGSLSIGDIADIISDITSVSGLSNITSISGNIGIQNCPKLTTAPFLNTITTTAGIAITSSGLTTLSFSNLHSFTGDFRLTGLSSLNHVDFKELKTVGWLSLDSCPLLTDLSFIKDLTSANSFSLRFLNATTITMDKLTSTSAGNVIYSCNNLTSVSFKSLTTVPIVLTLMFCPQLSNADFSSLSTVSGKLTVYGTNLTDLSGFSSLTTLGSLTIYSNPILANLHGLEHLTVLNSPAIGAGTSSTLSTRLNGIYIANNAKLVSLTGLQNVTSVPLIDIAGNTVLNDFCPLKDRINVSSKSPAYSYTYRNAFDMNQTVSLPALTLIKNGNYATTPEALATVALCN